MSHNICQTLNIKFRILYCTSSKCVSQPMKFDLGQLIFLHLVMILNDKTKNGTIIGSTILIDDDNYIYNQRSERLICKNNVLANFLWIYINSPVIKNKILQLVQGGTQIYANFSSVYNIDMYLPCIEEQNKISSFLNQLDDILEQEKAYLNQLKLLKRGLLQQMFV